MDDEEKHLLTLEALRDVDAGRIVSHRAVQDWAASIADQYTEAEYHQEHAMVQEIDIDKLDIKELKNHLAELKRAQKHVEKAIDSYEARKKAEAIAVLKAAAAEHGFTLSELAGEKGAPKKVHPPKYENPHNTQETWSGRGRQPSWIKDALSAGKSLDDFLIK